MSFPSLAIIGTAGRKEDQDRLTADHYERMVKATMTLMTHLSIDPQTVKIVSGGAAWADHIAVTLAKRGIIPCDHLTLYLPTSLKDEGYRGDSDLAMKSAKTANYYHRLFSEKTGYDSLMELHDVGRRGAHLIPGNGSFHARNSHVAKFVSPDGALVAFTFGAFLTTQRQWTIEKFPRDTIAKNAGLKDGGTAHTFDQAKCSKFHARIGEIIRCEQSLTI